MTETLDLDAEQRRAVRASERAIAVLAGPGSGKTRVLSYRARFLLQQHPTSRALLLTFTNKAAAEMKSRALGVATVASHRIHSHTYHSFCMRLLRSHGKLLGIDPSFEVMNDEEQKQFAAQAARSAGVHNQAYRWSKQRLRQVPASKAVAEFASAYEEAKRSASVLDFDDLVVYAAQLLQENKDLAAAYGAKYHHLLVDEFQDTNPAQFTVVRALATQVSTVSVFADDDQAIFRFAGAEVENIRRYCEDLGARVYPLTINYRSRARIVSCANRLILADGASSGRVMTAAKDGGEVRAFQFHTMEQEASALSEEIESLVTDGRQPESLAILVRSGYRAQVLLDCLQQKTLPVTNWLTQPGDSRSRRLLRVCLSVIRPTLNDRQVNELGRLFGLSDTGERITEEFLGSLEEGTLASELLSLHRLALEGASGIEVLRQAQACLRACSGDYAQSVDPLITSLSTFQEHDPDFSLDHVLSELALLGGSGAPTESGGIKVASLHRTKGLQWPHVYLLGLEHGHIPDYRATEDEELREERRLCFVGVCRAEERLTMTFVGQFRGHARYPSPFLEEMQVDFS